MKITIEFTTENSAFKTEHGETDKGAVIQQAANECKKALEMIKYNHSERNIRDVNGNKIGLITVEQ